MMANYLGLYLSSLQATMMILRHSQCTLNKDNLQAFQSAVSEKVYAVSFCDTLFHVTQNTICSYTPLYLLKTLDYDPLEHLSATRFPPPQKL